MKIVVTHYDPKTSRQRMFRVEASIEDEIKHPIRAFLPLGGKEYLLEIHLDK